jgi:hypothetical protein
MLITRLNGFFPLLWVVLAGRESKTTCGCAAEGLFWVIVCDFAGVHLAWECIRKRVRRAKSAGTNTKGRQMGRGEMGLIRDGSLRRFACLFGVGYLWRAMRVIALAHAVV